MTESGCPCAPSTSPRRPFNPPGLTVIHYRVGDFSTFRAALLRGVDGEVGLSTWSPGVAGDLAVQMVEWWAYLGDILTFYNERIAHDGYLRTASARDATARLVRALGYRPRPAIAAQGRVAAIIRAKQPVTLPVGLAIQSRPTPGEAPQVFEVDAATVLRPEGAVAARPAARPFVVDERAVTVYLRGAGSSVRHRERLLLTKRTVTAADLNDGDYVFGEVARVEAVKDPEENPLTEVSLAVIAGTLRGALAPSAHVLWRSHASMPFYSGKAETVVESVSTPRTRSIPGAHDTDVMLVAHANAAAPLDVARPELESGSWRGVVHLDGVARELARGDLILLDDGEEFAPRIASSAETVIWYANAPDDARPGEAPTAKSVIPIPVLHSKVTFRPKLDAPGSFNERRGGARLRYDFRPVGELAGPPALEVSNLPGTSTALDLAAPQRWGDGALVLVEDATERGAEGTVTHQGAAVSLAQSGEPAVLRAPLRAHANLVHVSRGKTVPREVLGSGDPTAAGQSFLLKQSPLTYLASSDPEALAGYASTLRVWVDDIEWKEVPSLYRQPPDARVFVTSEDSEQRTTVRFGDGEQGARPPAGVNNIVASYRYGGGAAAPVAGALSTILTPWPGLIGVRSPVAPGGGADPDPPEKIQRYAPRSVLTFGRAVSADDYEAIAMDAPGVARARAYFTWDGAEQRTLVKVYVGDDPAALASAKRAVVRAEDPYRPVKLLPVTRRRAALSLTVVYDPRRVAEVVRRMVEDALISEDAGLFSPRRATIGAAVYDSQVFDACLQVAGVQAVEGAALSVDGVTASGRHDPGEGAVFALAREDLNVTMKEGRRGV